MRLAKYLAHAGVASRRAAEQLVFAGRVTVGGEVVRDPARDVDERDDDRGRRRSRRARAPSTVVYALQQAGGRRLDRAATRRAARRSSTLVPSRRGGCTRSAGWTPTPPA